MAELKGLVTGFLEMGRGGGGKRRRMNKNKLVGEGEEGERILECSTLGVTQGPFPYSRERKKNNFLRKIIYC